jgi:hypothetical protein
MLDLDDKSKLERKINKNEKKDFILFFYMYLSHTFALFMDRHI